jgi:hypothetical protein
LGLAEVFKPFPEGGVGSRLPAALAYPGLIQSLDSAASFSSLLCLRFNYKQNISVRTLVLDKAPHASTSHYTFKWHPRSNIHEQELPATTTNKVIFFVFWPFLKKIREMASTKTYFQGFALLSRASPFGATYEAVTPCALARLQSRTMWRLPSHVSDQPL